MKNEVKYVLFIIVAIILFLFFLRVFNQTQLDDVSQGIYCEKELLETADVFYVIPKFEGIPISSNKSWCDEILSYGKKTEMHGIEHTYEEFNRDISEEELLEAMEIFKECFGFYPNEFKAPQMAINDRNKELVESKMKLISNFNQLTHKAYHCSDTGIIPNWFMRVF